MKSGINMAPKMGSLSNYLAGAFFLAGCAYTPPNFGPVVANQGSSWGPSVRLPPTQFNDSGLVSESFLGSSRFARINSVASLDYHFRYSAFHFSPSIYYLGFGSGAGFIIGNRTVLSLNGGISYLPLAYSSGISLSQAFYEKVFLGYGYNRATVNRVNCNGICVMEDEKKFIDYHHMSLSYLHSGAYLFDVYADYTDVIKPNIKFGISLAALRKLGK